MNLWQELFKPAPIEPFQPKMAEFNQAWEWLMKQPTIALTVVRQNSLLLRRSGVSRQTAEMALIDLWRRSRVGNAGKVAGKAVSVPLRRVMGTPAPKRATT